MRHLVLILGDQLDARSAALDGFDTEQDALWMAEVESETTHVWCHKKRIALFLAAMRHHRDAHLSRGRTVHYHELTIDRRRDLSGSHAAVLEKDVRRLKPSRLIVVEPGDFRVRQSLIDMAGRLGLELEIRPDRHFYCSTDEFETYARGRKSLILEFFYREMRRRHGVLMDPDGQPVGGEWNLDRENRKSFGRSGPKNLPRPRRFQPDDTTKGVLKLVGQRFASHPGVLDGFDLPVTREQSRQLLRHFVAKVLPDFGAWEDAMWTDEPFLYHSRLSVPLNLKLLDPRECVSAASDAFHAGQAPLNSVEGFIRQILGWREFIRGVYWLTMPQYAEENFFGHQGEVPSFYWDGQTDMNCVRHTMQHVLEHGYSHHIQRLMVMGNLALLLGVHPHRFHEWHMAMYLDAIDWVSLPNALGMSQFGDGGVVGTKPYVSTGSYIQRMSNYCEGCRFHPSHRTGDDACPFTTLYWDFLDRHEDVLRENRRIGYQFQHLDKLRGSTDEMDDVRARAGALRANWTRKADN
jgi:deoxyribodipyrimidine photolyase-related protein